MQTIGFYTYPRIVVGKTFPVEELMRDELAKFVRDVVFDWSGTDWMLRVSRDGLIQYRRESLERECAAVTLSWSTEDLAGSKSFEPLWQTYLSHINVIHFLLDCALHLNVNIQALQYQELNYLDTTRIRYGENDIALSQISYGGRDRDEMIRHGDCRLKSESELRRFEVPESVLTDLCRVYLSPVLESEEKIEALRPLAKALSDHNLRNYDVALVLCWFIAERYINDCWAQLLMSRCISGKRKDKLNSRDYTAAVKIEIMNLEGIFSDELYDAMNSIRVVRNGIAHQFGKRRATKQESVSALKLARELVEKSVGLQLPFHLFGLPIHGL